MKTTVKYLIIFPSLTLATISFKGNQEIIEPLNSPVCTSEAINVWINNPQESKFACNKNTTAVFKHEPKNINENVIKSDLLYKEKLNALNETVKRILRERKNK